MKKRFLHLFSLMLAVLMLIPCVGSAEEAEAVDNGVMREGLTALEATRLMGNGINLGNTLEACDNNVGIKTNTPLSYETHWGQPKTTQAMIDGMKAAGFDTIRIPVAWMTNATHLYEGDYTIDADYMDRVEEVVRYARKAGMYVIVNDHWDGGWYGMFGSESAETRALAMEAYKGMWQQIAERFRDYSDYLIFESANEELGGRFDENSPLYCSDSVVTYLNDDERYALTNEINQTFVDVVRATGGNNATRFLLIAGYGTNIDQTCDDRFQMPKDTAVSKLMVSVHYYDPWSYCGASSAASATKWGKVSDYEYMDQQLAKMTKFTEAGYGVVIGEYGALPCSDGLKDKMPWSWMTRPRWRGLCGMTAAGRSPTASAIPTTRTPSPRDLSRPTPSSRAKASTLSGWISPARRRVTLRPSRLPPSASATAKRCTRTTSLTSRKCASTAKSTA